MIVERAGVCGYVDCVLLQHLERDDLERPLVRRREHDRCGGSDVARTQPVDRRDAPTVAGDETREVVVRHRRGEVVADAALVSEELGADDSTHRVAADVLGTCRAAAVAIEARERIGATRFELATQDVAIGHDASIAGPWRPVSVVTRRATRGWTGRAHAAGECGPARAPSS